MIDVEDRIRAIEIEMAEQRTQSRRMATDIHEMKEMMSSLSKFITGRKAIVGFLFGLFTVLGGLASLFVGVAQLLKKMI